MKTSPVIECEEHHLPAILEIWNDSILHTTTIYDYRPRTLPMVRRWFEQKREAGHPVLGVEDDAGALLGFAAYGPFRHFPAYKYTVEHSVYVTTGGRGRGIGRRLMLALIERAKLQGLHVLVGVIDSANRGSIAFHENLGFQHSGTIRQAAFKFDRWLDVEFHQLNLETPERPADG